MNINQAQINEIYLLRSAKETIRQIFNSVDRKAQESFGQEQQLLKEQAKKLREISVREDVEEILTAIQEYENDKIRLENQIIRQAKNVTSPEERLTEYRRKHI